jgi:hypothetical protein
VSDAPVFVVVGHVNRGKSSVVSTLAADESVAIDDTPGTTLRRREYPMRVDGQVLYTLVDTPGFERARHVLAWLRDHEGSTSERRATLRRFVEEHASRGQFEQECELLRPILEGGAILYVVDSSIPFSPSSEAETEILRWSGRPRMALLNPVGEEDYSAEWRPVLDQYFSVVRVFDAHQADFERRLGLLRTMRELDDDWRPALDRAIGVLEAEHRQGRRESAASIARAIIEMQSHVETERLSREANAEPHKAALSEHYFDTLRAHERRLRAALRGLYAHHNLEVEEEELSAEGDDLFDLSTWSRLGLSRTQLATGGGVAGAAVGGGIDAAVGGASLLLGTLIGAAAGVASTWWGFERLAEVEVLGARLGGTLLRIGPMRNPAFPWVVLGRALHFHSIVSTRAHAARGAAFSDERAAERVVSELSGELRRPLSDLFGRLRKRPGTAEQAAIEGDLACAIEAVMEGASSETSPL